VGDNFEYKETETSKTLSEEEKNEILDSVKIKDTPVDIEPIIERSEIPLYEGTEHSSKKKRNRRSKIDSQDIEAMTDKEILDISSEEIQKLYQEISSFVEVKTEMKEDSGVKGIIPTNLKLLNAILGGGFIKGGLSTIIGNPGCGKTMLVLQSIGNAQLHFRGKIFAAVIDSEYSITTERMANLGIRYPKISPYSDNITVEKFFQYIETICLYKEEKGIINVPHIIGFDSIANTLTQKEREASDPKEVIGYRARVYSLLIPKYIAKCSKYNISILAINQLRDTVDMGRFSKPSDLKYMSQGRTVPGGNALRFNAFHFLEMRQRNMSKDDMEKYDIDGLVSEIVCVKNKLFRPKIPIKIIGDFARGFSDFWTNYIYLVDNKSIKSGAWNYLINFPTKKFRTKEAEILYNTDGDFKKAFDENVEHVLYEQIIKPNEIDISKEEIPDFWDMKE